MAPDSVTLILKGPRFTAKLDTSLVVKTFFEPEWSKATTAIPISSNKTIPIKAKNLGRKKRIFPVAEPELFSIINLPQPILPLPLHQP
jgi:hypothetical protein